jgi:putative endopeptidase
VRLTQSAFLCVLAGAILYAANEGSGFDRANFDTKCQPCEDFWRYANGGWMDRNPVPARFSSWGTMSVIKEANDERLKQLLEAARVAKKANSNERKIGDLYGACMDLAGIEARGLKPLQPHLDRIAKIKSPKDLVAAMTAMQDDSPVGPVTLYAGQDRKNSGETIANVYVNATSLPERDYYLSQDERQKKMRAEFVAHVAKMFELLGDSADAARKQAGLVLALETKFAEAALSRVQMRDPYATYHPMDFAALQALTPGFDWKPVFKLLNVPETTKINVARLESMKLLNELLSATPVEDWKTWLRWRVITNAADYLPAKLADEDFRFSQGVLAGVKERKPRWQQCAAVVDDKLGEALGQLFVEKHFPPAAKKRMLELVNNLKVTLGEELRNAEWLSPETRAQAVKKLEAFVPKIGYPDKWRDYSAVKVNAKQYFESIVSANVAERRHDLAKIGKPLDKTEWGMTPPTVNAYYSPLRNEIAFPAGILQPPMFDMTAGDEINYGAIGAVIGHEMGHGFDDQGSKFDAEGNLKNWWTAEDRQKFDTRSACMVKQFDTMDVGNGQHHNGKLVLGEALGDLGGLTLSYRAWKRSVKGKPEPPVVDGFTADQRFFLSFARVWASHYTPEATQLRLKVDPHPLAKFRANGTLMNMPEFHRAFQCKLGDKMVRPPEDQCKLW